MHNVQMTHWCPMVSNQCHNFRNEGSGMNRIFIHISILYNNFQICSGKTLIYRCFKYSSLESYCFRMLKRIIVGLTAISSLDISCPFCFVYAVILGQESFSPVLGCIPRNWYVYAIRRTETRNVYIETRYLFKPFPHYIKLNMRGVQFRNSEQLSAFFFNVTVSFCSTRLFGSF